MLRSMLGERLTPDVGDWFYEDFEFEVTAVTPEQIVQMELPTRPTKKTDPRARRVKGESVELDAFHPDKLRELVELCNEAHIDEEVLKQTHKAEQSERDTLAEFRKGPGEEAPA
jgi:hypothetical protein